jgi:hypothetical protein
VAPALLAALSEISTRSILPDHEVEWAWFDSQCDADFAPMLDDFLSLYDADALIGPACSVVALSMLDGAEYRADEPAFAIPTLSWAAASPMLSNKDDFPTFSRVVPSYSSHNVALLNIINSFSIERVAKICYFDGLWDATADGLGNELLLSEEFTGHDSRLTVRDDSPDDLAEAFVASELEAGTRLFVLLGYCAEMRAWAETIDAVRGDTRVSVVAYDFDENCGNDGDDAAAVAPFSGIWSLGVSGSAASASFIESLAVSPLDLNFEPFLQPPYGTIEPDLEAHPDAAASFESFMGPPSARSFDPDLDPNSYVRRRHASFAGATNPPMCTLASPKLLALHPRRRSALRDGRRQPHRRHGGRRRRRPLPGRGSRPETPELVHDQLVHPHGYAEECGELRQCSAHEHWGPRKRRGRDVSGRAGERKGQEGSDFTRLTLALTRYVDVSSGAIKTSQIGFYESAETEVTLTDTSDLKFFGDATAGLGMPSESNVIDGGEETSEFMTARNKIIVGIAAGIVSIVATISLSVYRVRHMKKVEEEIEGTNRMHNSMKAKIDSLVTMSMRSENPQGSLKVRIEAVRAKQEEGGTEKT